MGRSLGPLGSQRGQLDKFYDSERPCLKPPKLNAHIHIHPEGCVQNPRLYVHFSSCRGYCIVLPLSSHPSIQPQPYSLRKLFLVAPVAVR